MGGSVYTGLPIVETEEDVQIVIFNKYVPLVIEYNILDKIRPMKYDSQYTITGNVR
jgi:hypothetical protein